MDCGHAATLACGAQLANNCTIYYIVQASILGLTDVQSSLRDLAKFGLRSPALKRRAIFICPKGTQDISQPRSGWNGHANHNASRKGRRNRDMIGKLRIEKICSTISCVPSGRNMF
jgi:hypothetical protein